MTPETHNRKMKEGTRPCKRCGKPTGRLRASEICWDCKPIIDKENAERHRKKSREKKKEAQNGKRH